MMSTYLSGFSFFFLLQKKLFFGFSLGVSLVETCLESCELTLVLSFLLWSGLHCSSTVAKSIHSGPAAGVPRLGSFGLRHFKKLLLFLTSLPLVGLVASGIGDPLWETSVLGFGLDRSW